MTLRSFLGPALAATMAFALAALFFDAVRLPDLFPWSSAVVPAALTGLLAYGLGLLLPDGLYYTHAERMRLDLYTATGLTGTASQRVLNNVDQARNFASRLRHAATEMREDTAEMTVAAAEDLEDLADRLMAEPGRADSAITLISRANLVVDAVESFVAFKRDKGARESEIDAGRTRIIDSLSRMSETADAVHMRLARQKLTDLEVATDVAEGLFGRRER